MLQKTKAIVLHALKYGDSSLIVHAFTEEWGMKSFLLKGIRKSQKNNRPNMFQPLYLLKLDIYHRENRDLQWIKEAAFLDEVPGSGNDVVKATQAIFLSEILMKTIREEEKNAELFNFLQASLSYFNTPTKASPSFHLLFLFQLTRHLGFFPRNNYSELYTYFDTDHGSFSSSPGSSNLELERKLSNGWHACFNEDYLTVDQIFNKQESRNLFLDSILGFYRKHHHSMRELNSLEVLRTVFS